MSGLCKTISRELIEEVLAEVKEVEHHIHNRERWIGAGASAATLTPYTITSGNNTWGTEVLLLDTADTPVIDSMLYFDLHRIKVVAFSDQDVYKLQLVYGTDTFAAALSAGQYTELMVIAGASVGGASGGGPSDIRMPRLPTGLYKVWCRCWNAHNGDTLDLFIGLHEYTE